MIEMLAVLAIIGVLSVAAVAGLMWAFAKYKANNTIHDVHLWELAALDSQQLYSMTSGELVLNELGEVSTHGYPMAIMVQDENVFYISVDDVPQRVCSLTLDMVEEPMIVTVNGTSYTGSDICNADTNQMLFYYNKYMGDVDNTCIPACSGCQSCRNGTCYDNNTLCGTNEVCSSGACACAPGAIECQGSCYVCPEGYSLDTLTCSCTCDPQACPENAIWNSLTCSCECIEGYDMCNNTCHPQCGGSGMTGERDPDTCACICIEGTNADTCTCPQGYVYVEGQCQRVECRGGPTNYNCYINNALCGYNCDSTGHNCQYGICYAEECPNNLIFKKITSPWYVSGGYFYGCNIPGTECYKIPPKEKDIFCFTSTSLNQCCVATLDGTCVTGICEASKCPSESTFYHSMSAPNPFSQRGGCLFDNGIRCYPTNEKQTKWTCYSPSGLICDSSCSNPPECNGNCDEPKCYDGQTYDPETGYCCIDDICCDYNHEGTPECYRSGLRCASGCGNSATNCRTGNCYDPGCSTVGMKYGYISAQDFWGCIDPNLGENGMACLYRSDYAPAECNYNKTTCGRQCNYDGTECGSVYMKECMTGGECLQDGTIINNCTCSGQITTINSISYCCPEGHTYTNGGCTLINCPDGQVADEGGICKTACKNNTEVLDCICPGTTHTNQFNAKICCETGYTWNENTQTCQ